MPKLPTYDDACEQLGGRPWLEKPEATDRWFLVDAQSLLTSPPLTSAASGIAAACLATPSGGVVALSEITGTFDLKKRMSLSTKLVILAIAAFSAIVAVAVNL